ncbi:hypothetical protein MIND_00527900 [Mycena indigotica]|uniref:Uncharacterized protein n=1 Tax=Mycena indigotica TaxID=2126181 RepID=A0A8H6SXU5_9AGAR|nr:uncharacterized protein MIND_00527900 [Mycena indigotica]KAF7307339.1 hypothetical protein MIND_00527900 [Mycena indigotica]
MGACLVYKKPALERFPPSALLPSTFILLALTHCSTLSYASALVFDLSLLMVIVDLTTTFVVVFIMPRHTTSTTSPLGFAFLYDIHCTSLSTPPPAARSDTPTSSASYPQERSRARQCVSRINSRPVRGLLAQD